MSKFARFTIALAAVAVISAAGVTAVARAEEAPICDLQTDSMKSCRAKVSRSLASAESTPEEQFDEKKSEKEDATVKELTEKNTGTGAVLSGRQAVTDFLLKVAFATDNGGISDEDDEAVTLELNDFLGLPTDDGYKLSAELRPADVSTQLLELIPEDQRTARKEDLEKTLGDLDDVRISFSYSPVTKRFGRKEDPHEDLWDALFESVWARVEEASSEASDLAIDETELLGEIIEAAPDLKDAAVSDDLKFADVAAQVGPDEAQELMDAVIADWVALTTYEKAIQEEFDQSRFVEMADLIDNQPQLVFTASRTIRDDLVGANETRAKFTYEMGFKNVNSLRDSLERCLAGGLDLHVESLLAAASAEGGDDEGDNEDEDEDEDEDGDEEDSTAGTALAGCYEQFFSLESTKKSELGHRLSFSAEYVDIENHSVTLPGADAMSADAGVALMLASDSKLTGNLTYGRYLAIDPDGRGRSRVDLSWSYEKVDNEMVRNTRSIVELTYAQRLTGDFVFSGGLVWANRPEFRGEVDEEVSARLGVKYKLVSDKKFGTP